MKAQNPFPQLAIGEFFETLLPDFVLAFAFFTALAYAVLSRRFHHQRSAVTMSATMGLALSVGLVWWEQSNSLSTRDLGPIAVGFAIILVAFVMYQAIRQVGGSWAGAGIALGAALLISKLLGLDWALEQQLLHTAISVTLVVGLLAFLLHQMWHAPSLVPRHVRELLECGGLTPLSFRLACFGILGNLWPRVSPSGGGWEGGVGAVMNAPVSSLAVDLAPPSWPSPDGGR